MTGYTTPYTLLVHEDGHVVEIGDTVTSFRGDTATVVGWRAGSHPGSTGRILVDDGWGSGHHEYFPSVYGCHVEDDEVGRIGAAMGAGGL